MPKRIMPLMDIKIAKATPQKKTYTLFDGGGLYLLITTTWEKLWRFKHRSEGKGQLFALGAYPEISLADVRERKASTRKQFAAVPGTLLPWIVNTIPTTITTRRLFHNPTAIV